MIVAIHQPNYIPWSGYFHKIIRSDVFVLLDDVQYVKGTVANKNFIKGKNTLPVPLSVSVKLSNGAYQKYNEIEIDYLSKWHFKHINQLKDAYIKAPYFKTIFPSIEQILTTKFDTIASLNTEIILWVCKTLEINTKIYVSSSLNKNFGTNNFQNINICKHFNATKYLSGTGAKKYNDEQLFHDNQLQLIYTNYKSMPYNQINGSYIENLSILDLLFNLPPDEIKTIIYNQEAIY